MELSGKEIVVNNKNVDAIIKFENENDQLLDEIRFIVFRLYVMIK